MLLLILTQIAEVASMEVHDQGEGHEVEDEREQQRSIWIYLLEKAYAKVKGGYKYLEGGSTGDVMRDLTGFPMTRFDFNDQAVISMF